MTDLHMVENRFLRWLVPFLLAILIAMVGYAYQDIKNESDKKWERQGQINDKQNFINTDFSVSIGKHDVNIEELMKKVDQHNKEIREINNEINKSTNYK